MLKNTRGLALKRELKALNASVVMAILIGGREHPCDRCNEDRKICHGFPRKNDLEVIL
jgi:hypothetical protein